MSFAVRQRSSTILPKRPKLAELGSARRETHEQKEKEDKECQEKLEERRINILTELFRTEATYVEYLQVAITIFYNPIKNATSGPAAISAEKREQIFQNIETLKVINSDLLKQFAIRKAKSNGEIGNGVWIDMLTKGFSDPLLREAYQTYMHGYEVAANTLAKLSTKEGTRKNTSFGNWLQNQLAKNSDLCRGLSNLPAFLICPVQRLPRYLLILRDLEKCTPKDHPDYPHLQEAYGLIKEIVGAIDHGKTRYDEIQYLQGLYGGFNITDRESVQELMDPQSILLTEAPILLLETVNNSFQLRHFILLTNMLICAKKRKDNFSFKFKVDFYKCVINFHEQGDGMDDTPYIQITAIEKKFGDVLTTEVSRTFFTFSEEGCAYNYEFWMDKLLSTQMNLLDVSYVSQCANQIVADLQTQILLKRDWDLFSVGASVVTFSKGDEIINRDTLIEHLYFVNSGRCSVTIRGHVMGTLLENDFYGERTFVGATDAKGNCKVIAESDKVSVTKISFDRLTSMLSGNNDLARRFFHVVALVSARSYLKRVARELTLEKVGEEETEEIEAPQDPPCPESNDNSIIQPDKRKKANPILVKLKLEETAPDEEILQEFSCKLKKTKFSGQLYVMKNYIGFYSHILGKKKRLVVPGKAVTEVVARDNCCVYINNLKHNIGPFELQFKNQQQKQEAYTILASFLSDKKRSLAAKTGLRFTASNSRNPASSFCGINEENWKELMASGEEMFVDEGDVIVTQGFMHDAFYQITKGECSGKVQDPETKQFKSIHALSPGQTFGEISLLLGIASNRTIEAKTNVSLLAVSRQKVEALILSNPVFGAAFYKFISQSCFSSLLELDQEEAERMQDSTPLVQAPLLKVETLNIRSGPIQKSPAIRRHTAASRKKEEDSSPLPSPLPSPLSSSPPSSSTLQIPRFQVTSRGRGVSFSSEQSPREEKIEKGTFSPGSESPTSQRKAGWISGKSRDNLHDRPRRSLLMTKTSRGDDIATE